MPGMDGTGPLRPGLPGRGAGPCGAGMRRMGRRGAYGPSYSAAQRAELSNDEKKKILQEHLKGLEEEIKSVQARIKELDA